MFTLQISTDNVAFDEVPEAEVAKILREAADMVERCMWHGVLVDSNGNEVGRYNVLIGKAH